MLLLICDNMGPVVFIVQLQYKMEEPVALNTSFIYTLQSRGDCRSLRTDSLDAEGKI